MNGNWSRFFGHQQTFQPSQATRNTKIKSKTPIELIEMHLLLVHIAMTFQTVILQLQCNNDYYGIIK